MNSQRELGPQIDRFRLGILMYTAERSIFLKHEFPHRFRTPAINQIYLGIHLAHHQLVSKAHKVLTYK